MSVFDELLQTAIAIAERYGWYLVGIFLVWEMINSFKPFIKKLIGWSEQQRIENLDYHFKQARKKQIILFQSRGKIMLDDDQ